jgi:hypothetical protein
MWREPVTVPGVSAIDGKSRGRRVGRLTVATIALVAACGAKSSSAQTPATSWLDRPLKNWNVAGAALPNAGLERPVRDQVLKRCQLNLLMSTAAERALASAGWISYLNFDQQLVQDDLEIVDGMTGADGMCRPTGYNVFVFVRGRFAGTLSPDLMSSRLDGSSGAVRIVGAETISAEFARYTDKDALCCPSSRITVRYRIDRSGTQPVVVPMDVRTTRGL